ncbi:MAG: DNA replication/repair protein RecF [Chthonomonas sp.]|nr:DNA replication/repair protein RecF [Chthonomonas sp.]
MLADITLRTFRNYDSLSLRVSPGINLIHGRNGHGKTNLVEAVFLLSTGRLLRGGKDADCIQHGQDEARVVGTCAGDETEINVQLNRHHKKRITINGVSVVRASDVLGRLPSVTFIPEDLALVSGEPAERRLYLDSALSQALPGYLNHLAAYKRALQHRNALLKLAQNEMVDDGSFAVWEQPLHDHGIELRRHRTEFLDSISSDAKNVYRELSGGELFSLHYAPKDEGSLIDELRQTRQLDIRRGATQLGPHRDDIALELMGTDLRTFGSQGQRRSAAITLKLCELIYLDRIMKKKPMLLLDDIFSELDHRRRENLLRVGFASADQVFITCTEIDNFHKQLIDDAATFRVESGTVIAE